MAFRILEFARAAFGRMEFDSPAKSSNASTPTRRRTRSMTSRDGYMPNDDKVPFSLAFGDLGDDFDPDQDFVNGKILFNISYFHLRMYSFRN